MSVGRGGGYVLSSRDLLANDIEAVVEGAQLDGMVCLASCDKTTPGQLMAAARLDVPTLVLACGYQSCGQLDDGERVDIEEVFLQSGRLKFGGISLDGLCDLADRAITGPGVCTGMGTANSMHIAGRGARDDARRNDAGACEQPGDVGRGARRRRGDRRRRAGRPPAAHHPDRRRVRATR